MADDFTSNIAVLVGIGAYDAAVGRLATPVPDAEAVAALLKNNFGYQVLLLRDQEATLAGLRRLLDQELLDRVGEGSRLLFYFAGHGVAEDSAEVEGPRGFLVPQDATAAVTTHLSMDDLREALTRLPCRHLLVLLDCCFSGAFHWENRRPLHVPGELLYEERYLHWVRHPARWALASSAHDEYALDVADRRRGQVAGHSPFASALLDGLRGAADRFPEGGDGIITLAELYAYVRDRLAPHQSPVMAPLKGQTRGEFVFRNPLRPLALQSAEIAVQLKPELNPYRGLEPYRSRDAARFFGRGDATRLLRSWVESHPWSLLVGPSGSGKSSLLNAGLRATLGGDSSRPWIAPATMRVTKDPFEALGRTLAAIGGSAAPDEADLSEPEWIKAWTLAWTAAAPSVRLLIGVDQAEELVTRVPRSGSEKDPDSLPEKSARFLACLAAMIEGGGEQVRVVVVVRSDFEADLDGFPQAHLLKSGRFVVPPLRREDLREIIESPAASRALYFDDPRLVDRLVDEVWGMPGGLPLLSYTLSQLFLIYVKAGRGDRLLTERDLQAIGGELAEEKGVAGGSIVRILRNGADKSVAGLPLDQRETIWRILLRMVNLVGARPTRRQVPLSELDYPQAGENGRVKEVLHHFIDQERLLVSGRADELDPQQAGTIEPAHDELLVSWPQLVRKIDEARQFLPAHRRLTEAATAWIAGSGKDRATNRRKRDLDLRLLELVETSGLPSNALNRSETEYIDAARAERRRRTRQRWTAVVAALVLTSGAALFFRYQSQIARSRELAALALAAGFRDRGLLLAEAAYRTRPTLEARASLFGLLSTLRHAEVFLHGLPPGVRSVVISADGKWVAAGGYHGKIAIWDLTAPSRPRWLFEPPPAPEGRENQVHALAFVGAELDLLAAYEWGGVRLWRPSTSSSTPVAGWPQPSPGTSKVSTDWEGADPEPPELRGERPVTVLVRDGAGKSVVAGDSSGRLLGIDLPTLAVSWTRQLDLLNIDQLALVDGKTAELIIAADSFGRLQAIEPSSGKTIPFTSRPHSSQLKVLRNLPSRQELLSLDSTGNLVRWKVGAAGFELADQSSLPLLPRAAELDLSRQRLLIAVRGREIRSFSLETDEELEEETLVGHRLNPLAINCSELHPRCVSGEVGGGVIVWNTERSHPLLEATRSLDGSVQSLHYEADGQVEAVVQTESGIAQISMGGTGSIHNRPAENLMAVGVPEDGKGLAMGFSDGRVIFRQDPSSQGGVSLEGSGTSAMVRFAVSSRFVAGVDQNRRLFIWRSDQPGRPLLMSKLDQLPSSLRFSPNERLLVAGSLGGQLARWDLTTTPPELEQAQKILNGPIFALAFSPDGSRLFTGSGGADRYVREWDPWSLRLVRELPERHTQNLSAIQVAANSKLLISAGEDGEVVLWDTESWREIGALPHGVDTLFQAIALDRNHSLLATADNEQIWTWRIADVDLVEAACRIANRSITAEEWEQLVGGTPPEEGCAKPP